MIQYPSKTLSLTFRQELFDDICSFIKDLVESSLDFLGYSPDLRRVPACARFQNTRILARHVFDDLDETGFFAKRITVQFAHMRTTNSLG